MQRFASAYVSTKQLRGEHQVQLCSHSAAVRAILDRDAFEEELELCGGLRPLDHEVRSLAFAWTPVLPVFLEQRVSRVLELPAEAPLKG